MAACHKFSQFRFMGGSGLNSPDQLRFVLFWSRPLITSQKKRYPKMDTSRTEREKFITKGDDHFKS